MNAVDRSNCESSSDGRADSNDGSDFNSPLRDTTAMALEKYAPDLDFLETDSVIVALEDPAAECSFVETDCFMSE